MRLHAAAAIVIAVGWVASVPGSPRDPSARQSAAPTLLLPGTAIEREISGPDRHAYEVRAAPGQVVAIEVEQVAIDVVVQLVAGEDPALVRVDDEYRMGAGERLLVPDALAATHSIVVRPARTRSSAGTYRITSRVREVSDKDRALFEVQELRTRSEALYRTHRSADALVPARRALEIAERVFGGGDPVIGLLTLDLGRAYEGALDHAAAQREYERALELLTAALGPDDPQVAITKRRLGAMYSWAGDFAAAERMLNDALRRQEQLFGPEHPFVAMTLMAQAGLLERRGDLTGAERLYQRAAVLITKWFGTEDEWFGILQNNLGTLYMARRDFARAEGHLERAVAVQEKILGPDHPRLATPIQNLGMIAREKKDYAAAERHYLRALAMREASVGLDHPMVVGTLNNLANVYGAQGDHARSLEVHLRGLAIAEKHATPWSQPTLFLGNVARTYAALGDYANALIYQRRADAAIESEMVLNLAIGSERQKIAYLSSFVAERTERTLSFHLRLQPDNPEAARLAAETLLQRKGRVLDVMTNTLAPLRAHAAPADQQRLDRLGEITTRFARIALAGPGKASAAEHLRTLRELDDAREQLEAEITRRSDEARAALQRVSLEAVQQVLPPGAVLVEFAVYRPFNPKAPSMTVAYGTPRYAAYVIHKALVSGFDLGEAAPIDAAVDAYRSALQDPDRTDVKRLARALDDRIMRPLRGVVPDGTRLLVSPDGPLALIPFEALVDEKGTYLIERYPVSYLSAGRDLLRMQVPRTSRDADVIVADPRFGEPRPSSPAGEPDDAARRATADPGWTYFVRRGSFTLPRMASLPNAPRAVRRPRTIHCCDQAWRSPAPTSRPLPETTAS
jgi:tetratricopeptide (TPR) repeat protein